MNKPRKSTILTGINAAGVILTAYLSSKAAIKAKEAIHKATLYSEEDELTLKEKVKIAAPIYIPTVIAGAGTIAAGIAANKIDAATITALTVVGAKKLKDFKDYRNAVIAVDGPEKDQQYRQYIVDHQLIDDQDGDMESRYWFYEPWSDTWFESCKADVYLGFAAVNKALIDPNSDCYGMPTLSTFYEGCRRPDLIGPEQKRLGWDIDDLNYNCDCYILYFDIYRCDDDGELIDPYAKIDGRPKYRIETLWGAEYLDVIDTQLKDAGLRD